MAECKVASWQQTELDRRLFRRPGQVCAEQTQPARRQAALVGGIGARAGGLAPEMRPR